jgi:hypothetical protein
MNKITQPRDHGRFARICHECAKRANEVPVAVEAEAAKWRHTLCVTKLDYERRLRNLRGWLALIVLTELAAALIFADLHFGWL